MGGDPQGAAEKLMKMQALAGWIGHKY